ncbi:MAG: hypothetical protein ABL925_06550 [Methylococcales bacterium]
MKNYLLSVFALTSLCFSWQAFSGELCQKNGTEYTMEEARKYSHLAKDILFKYDYNAKEILAQQPTSEMDHCLKLLLEPISAAEHLIVSNKDYEDMEPCEKYELIATNAKAFTRKYAGGHKIYFQSCLNNNPSTDESNDVVE